jgi:hypothetical protein
VAGYSCRLKFDTRTERQEKPMKKTKPKEEAHANKLLTPIIFQTFSLIACRKEN